MNREDLRGFSSESDSDDVIQPNNENTDALNVQWKTLHNEAENDAVDYPSFEEIQVTYRALSVLDESMAPHLTGGCCYYLGCLDGPESSILSVGNKKRHVSYIEKRLSRAKQSHLSLLDQNHIGVTKLLRVYISCMVFGDTDPSRSEVAKWYGLEDTVDTAKCSQNYTPYEQFVEHNRSYIEAVATKVCSGTHYLVPSETTADGTKNVAILKKDVRYAIQNILWKCLPDAEKMSYQSYALS